MVSVFRTKIHLLGAVLAEMGNNMGEKTRLKRRPRPSVDKEGNSLKGKTAIVTGANRGIGKETVVGLLQRGCRVILACRDTGLGKQAADELIAKYPNGEVEVMKLDLASFPSVREFAREVNQKESRIDILVNNAGLITPSSRVIKPENVDGHEGLETITVVNYLSGVLLTTLLYDKIKATPDSKILCLSSNFHLAVNKVDLDDPSFKGDTVTYANAKLAFMAFVKKLATKALTDGIRVYGIDPGVSPSDFTRETSALQKFLFLLFRPWMRSVADAANSTLVSTLVDDKETYQPDKFYFCDGIQSRVNHALNDKQHVDEVWNKTKDLLKTNFEISSQ